MPSFSVTPLAVNYPRGDWLVHSLESFEDHGGALAGAARLAEAQALELRKRRERHAQLPGAW